ncbi:MAG: hypothetical protein CTY24_08025 [Methylobacter sp.]|nr:MAG: hypothetical protein CTY24_08025 [Methylobacter sp.]
MKVLFLNNYDMLSSYGAWQKGEYPAHHLWGAAHLKDFGVDTEILPFEKFPGANSYWRLQRLLKLDQLGMRGLDQQLRALVQGHYDLIYSACQNHSFLLARLRAWGILRTPVIAVIHHPIVPGSVEKVFFTGHDRLICLSESVRQGLLTDYAFLDPGKVIKLDWGVDEAFYGDYREAGADITDTVPVIVSAGKSNRDHDVLVNAANGLNCQVRIYCSEDSRPKANPLPSNVVLTTGAKRANPATYRELVEVYKQAFAVAIPINKTNALAGLTSLMDALAVGRPVIMTRNPYIDIDIEALGIGIWCDIADAAGWRAALSRLLNNPAEAAQMGRKARQLADEKYNIVQFTSDLAAVFTSLPRA